MQRKEKAFAPEDEKCSFFLVKRAKFIVNKWNLCRDFNLIFKCFHQCLYEGSRWSILSWQSSRDKLWTYHAFLVLLMFMETKFTWSCYTFLLSLHHGTIYQIKFYSKLLNFWHLHNNNNESFSKLLFKNEGRHQFFYIGYYILMGML